MIKKIIFLLFIPFTLYAHGGEDHSDAKKTAAKSATYFSNEAVSDLYELLFKYQPITPGKEATLKLYVSNFITNAPVDSAVIQIAVEDNPNIKLAIKQVDKGVYEVKGIFPEKKSYNLTVNINTALGPDLILIKNIETGKQLPVAHEESAVIKHWYQSTWFLITAGILAGMLLMFFVMKKTNRRVAAGIIILLSLLPTAIYNTASAHGGEDDEAGGKKGGSLSTTFILEKESQFLFKILTQKIETGDFKQSIQVLGTVVASPQGRAVIQTPQTGKIISLRANPGQMVSAGQVIAVVEQTIDAGTQSSIIAQNSDWKAKRNEVEAQYTAAKIQYDRLMKIADIVAKKDITEAKARLEEATKNKSLYQNIPLQKVQAAKYFNLSSPISGVVGNYNYAVGSVINSGETLMEVTNLSKVFVEAQAFAADAIQLKNIDKITTTSTNKTDTAQYQLKLISTAQEVNAANQSQKVIFEIINPKGQFKIGESINLNLFSKNISTQLVIPNDAIAEINGKPAIFIKDKAEQYSISYISKGTANGQYTTIMKGAEEGERVITGGVYQMKTIYLNQ
ncbi:MAG: efflux RND transporter periplasmic adaptor subunit [Ferruginibacter sp.]